MATLKLKPTLDVKIVRELLKKIHLPPSCITREQQYRITIYAPTIGSGIYVYLSINQDGTHLDICFGDTKSYFYHQLELADSKLIQKLQATIDNHQRIVQTLRQTQLLKQITSKITLHNTIILDSILDIAQTTTNFQTTRTIRTSGHDYIRLTINNYKAKNQELAIAVNDYRTALPLQNEEEQQEQEALIKRAQNIIARHLK